ncbi:MAG: EAL domain-containing protein [Pseudomonadota bacterium]
MSLFNRVVYSLLAVDPRRLWLRYAIGLTLILILTGVSHGISFYAIHASGNDAVFINKGGQQRTLSQQILYFASAYHREGGSERKAALKDVIDRFEASHEKLANPGRLNGSLKAIYFDNSQLNAVDYLTRNYINDAREVLTANDAAGRLAAEEALDRMAHAGPDHLLTRLETAVAGFESVATANLATLQIIQETMLAATILTVLLIGLLIFWPAHKAVNRAFSRLEKQKSAMKRTQTDLIEGNLELRRAKEDIEYQATHDALTGLHNRRFLEAELDRRIRASEGSDERIAVLHIDLDKFKQINDTLGHAAGDYILTHVAVVLKEASNGSDVVARVGGDEFVIVRTGPCSETELAAIADEIITELSKPVPYDDNVCHFGASIGIDIGITSDYLECADIDELLVNADVALYKAKERGRGCYQFFTPALKRESSESKLFSNEILSAVTHHEFIPHYQLQFDAKTGLPVGAEALVRWDHRERGLLLPGEFMPTAQSLQAMGDIDAIMLETVLRDYMAHWRDHPMMRRISLNLSAQRLNDPDFVARLDTLSQPREVLSFEISETVNLEGELSSLLEPIGQLKRMGYNVEIDDFGTAHASILTLQRLKPDRLKIARELVSGIAGSERERVSVELITRLADVMGVEVVAEGVETAAQAQVLKSLGCDILQGFHYSKPMPALEVNEVLTRFSERLASEKRA